MTSQSLTNPVLSPVLGNLRTAAGWTLASAGDTRTAAAATAARLTLAAVMLPHGLQKTVGLFGGYGWSGTMGFFTEQMGLPWLVAAAVILIEVVGPVLLLAGLAVRPVALAFIGLMAGAIATVHGQYGFFMNWYGQQSGEGYEYHLLVIGLAAVLTLIGSGRWGVDHALDRRLQR